MKITQTSLAKALNVSTAYINYLVNCKKRPNWKTAKKLSEITKTDPVLWLEGTAEEIKAALEQLNSLSKEPV